MAPQLPRAELGAYRGLRPACSAPLAPALHAGRSWRDRWRGVRRTALRILGAPDYASYVEHLRRCHPLTQPPSEREYVRMFFDRRERGAMRCC